MISRALQLLLAVGAVQVLFVATIAQAQITSNVRGYNGPVASVRTESVEYWNEDGKVRSSKRKLDSIERFDTAGRLIEEKSFTEDGGILYQYRHSHDSQDRKVESVGSHSEFVYLPDRIVYTYDAVGNLVREDGFDSHNKLVNKSEYAYDEKCRRIRWTSFSYHPEEKSKPNQWTYDYYDNDLIKNELGFTDKGDGFRPTDSLGGPHRKFYMYDSRNKPIFVLLYNVNGVFVELQSTTYDKQGNELEEIRYESNGALKSKTKYSYAFDRRGNYVVQKTYEWDLDAAEYVLSEISYQTIEYRK